MGTEKSHQGGQALTEAVLQHARLQELVASFADGELPREERRAVEEHLDGCGRCQRELALQQTLFRALAREHTPRASPGLRRRIEWMGDPGAGRHEHASTGGHRWAAPALAALVLIVAAAGTALHSRRIEASRPMSDIPMLRDALADCRRAMARNFPRKADLAAVSEGMEFPVRALHRPGVELFSTWKTTLAGSQAAGLAYRWRGIVVVQYAVPAVLIRQHPAMGDALSNAGFYAASHLGQGVIAVVEDGSGMLLVADVPPEDLRRLIL
ncbi:MAG: anti-sigma factor [Myxococcales bacterium]